MILRWLIASIHLLGLVVAVVAVFTRARALGRARDAATARPALTADNWWALSAILLLSTGLWRLLGGLEKGTAYYLANPLFHAKLGIFALVIILELWPLRALMGWRRALRGSREIDVDRASTFARISYLQMALVVVMVFLATAMARGLGV